MNVPPHMQHPTRHGHVVVPYDPSSPAEFVNVNVNEHAGLSGMAVDHNTMVSSLLVFLNGLSSR